MNMKTKIAVLALFFLLTPIFIFSLIFYQLSLLHASTFSSKNISILKVASEIAQTPIGITTHIDVHEARVDALSEFFARYNSPLQDYASQIVQAADKYGLDYRLIPAIAMQESILCRRIPKNSYNCWGFGIYGGKVKRFANFSDAIETVTKTLALEYHDKGLKEPSEIVSKYTPGNTNDWSGNVSYIMGRIASSL
jgi:hypothetical protein